MFTPKLKLLATPEKTRPAKPFVQVEGKLTEEQLEAIAGGSGGHGCPPWNCGVNHNETIVSAAQLNFEGGNYV